MFIGFFDFCQELMSGYKIWLIFTVILCMILLKFGYAFMLEIHNEDYPDEFDDEDDLEEEKAEEERTNEDSDNEESEVKKEPIAEEQADTEQTSEESENPVVEDLPVAEPSKVSQPGTELTVEMASDNSDEEQELTPQQQKTDKVLTFLSITMVFLVLSGLIMKIILFILGLILTLVGGIFESILGIVIAVIFFIFLAFIL